RSTHQLRRARHAVRLACRWRYTLTTLGDQISAGGSLLDGDGNGTPGGNHALGFFRLFGDSDGDGDVDGLDLAAFRNAYGSTSTDPNYNRAFDFDGDGDVDGLDLGQFRLRYGTTLP